MPDGIREKNLAFALLKTTHETMIYMQKQNEHLANQITELNEAEILKDQVKILY